MMTATKTQPTGVEIDGAWLGQWHTAIMAALESTRYQEQRGGSGPWYAGSGDVSIRVIPDGYATAADGRDWAGHKGCETVHILQYEGGDYYSLVQGERLLRQAVQALHDLPSGMGWRHGRVVVSVRTATCRPGHRVKVVAEWCPAEVRGRGITFHDAPEVA